MSAGKFFDFVPPTIDLMGRPLVASLARLLGSIAKPLAGTVLLLSSLVALPTAAAPKAELWDRWTAHDPQAISVINHGSWGQFLKPYLSSHPDGVNRIAYGRVTEADRARLERYISGLEAIPISTYNRDEQLAYWINLYNALTVKVVLDHYPVKSILRISISPGFFSFGPWDKKLVRVEGEELTLNDIEHRILRPIWRDPRIHYALNCASIGCPNLRDVPFTAENSDRLLTRAAFDYVNHPRGAEAKNGRLVVSSIYEWYQEDFGGTDEGVIQHLHQYAKPPLADALSDVTRIASDRYDWDLNEAS